MRYLHTLADHVTVNSYRQKENMELHYRRLRGRITTIYNGVDLSMFHPPEPRTRTDDTKRLKVISVGTIHPHKNPSVLIRALAMYRQRYNDLPFGVTWVGKTSYFEPRDLAFQEANTLIARLKLEEHWEWLGERSDVPELLRQHDVLLHPSAREGLSNAICEALACGRPVLAGRIADHSRLIEHGSRGFIFDQTDPGAIADTLRKFVQLRPHAREEMGKRARAFAEQELSLSCLTDAYERLFVELTSRRANRTTTCPSVL